MFELDEFIADCRAALTQDKTHRAVQEVVARAVADPPAILRALGEPTRGAVNKLYHASDLTILNFIWPPRLTLLPHNHNMWAVIGIYTGREDNVFWRRVSSEGGKRIEPVGAISLSRKDVEPLADDVIHSVTNPIAQLTAAIHVYGGDYFGTPRSEWDRLTLMEERLDVAKNLRLFEEANAAAGLT